MFSSVDSHAAYDLMQPKYDRMQAAYAHMQGVSAGQHSFC